MIIWKSAIPSAGWFRWTASKTAVSAQTRRSARTGTVYSAASFYSASNRTRNTNTPETPHILRISIGIVPQHLPRGKWTCTRPTACSSRKTLVSMGCKSCHPSSSPSSRSDLYSCRSPSSRRSRKNTCAASHSPRSNPLMKSSSILFSGPLLPAKSNSIFFV